MNRLVTEIDWRKRFIDPIGLTYTPFAQLRGDLLQASNFVDPQDPQGATQNTSLARGLALAGVTISYPWVANASYGSHVIEPIGQVIARQASINQSALPDEDAKSLVFDDTNLFDWNKFSGYDRIETGTRANVGLQYTFQSNYGPYARILAGESFQLAGVNPYKDPGVDANGIPIFNPLSGLQNARVGLCARRLLPAVHRHAAHLAVALQPAEFGSGERERGCATDGGSSHGECPLFVTCRPIRPLY